MVQILSTQTTKCNTVHVIEPLRINSLKSVLIFFIVRIAIITTFCKNIFYSKSRIKNKNDQTESSKLAHDNMVELNDLMCALSAYASLGTMIIVGNIKDFFRWLRRKRPLWDKPGYAPFFKGFVEFYIRRVFHIVRDSWNRSIYSCPGDTCIVKDELFAKYGEEDTKKCVNMGSYNYLGFASVDSPTLPHVKKAVDRYSVSLCSNMGVVKTNQHFEVERKIARKTGKEACALFSMGFGCNATFIPFLLHEGDLVLSDEKNHSSIVNGFFAAKASVRVFAHNDTKQLEKMIREEIVNGQTRVNRAWDRIFIFVEGLYSMEGYYPKLKEIVSLKQKYRCYLFVDEAHSFGAIGTTGSGVCEKLKINPSHVDILMGTFTKSYGAFGGYIASTKKLIDEIKERCQGYINSQSIPPAVCQQIISAMDLMEMNEGRKRLKRLRSNSNYFRQKLIEAGYDVKGSHDSPVAVIIISSISGLACFSRECFRRNIATVIAGFPATQLTKSRARFCISAAHTREQLDYVLSNVDQICDLIHFRYKKRLGG